MVYKLLEQLGVDLPIQPTFEDVQQALSETATKLANRPIEDLVDLPMMSEPEVLAAMQAFGKYVCISLFGNTSPYFR